MRMIFAVPLAITLSLSFSSLSLPASALEPEKEGDGGSAGDLTIDYYRDVARRFPERLGLLCWVGYETYKSGGFQDARGLFETCAEQNHPQSMIFLSQIYAVGSGVARDPVVAAQWLRRAAETGYSTGQYNYGLALLRGEGVPCDLEAGRAWMRKAAAQGDSDAQALVAADFDLSVVPAGKRPLPPVN